MKNLNLKYVVTVVLLAAILFTTAKMIIILQDHYQVMAFPQGYNTGNYTFGTVSSIQYDNNGKPAWIVTGIWKGNLPLSNHSSGFGEAEEIVANRSTADGSSSFNTQFEMVRLDGKVVYDHTITNFVITNISQPNNTTKVFSGTTTASMKEEPVTDIPTSITITGGKVISIQLDPSKVDDHFGNTPIYGLVIDDHRSNQSKFS